MTTDSYNDVSVPDAFADAWAAVFIDVYEKLKERGELPDDPDDPTPSQNGEKLPATSPQCDEKSSAATTNDTHLGVSLCPTT